MKKVPVCVVLSCTMLLTSVGCKKDDVKINLSISVENLSGTYAIKALVWEAAGQSLNVYDQLDNCEKDNLIKLNADKTASFIDAGVVCDPPENDNGVWNLANDSLYFDSEATKIKSFDGKTLVLVGHPDSEPSVTGTTTLEKQ